MRPFNTSYASHLRQYTPESSSLYSLLNPQKKKLTSIVAQASFRVSKRAQSDQDPANKEANL
jgi:hypothetical protein